MEQAASGCIMTGIRRAFSAHLPLTSLLLEQHCCCLWPSLLLFGPSSTIIAIIAIIVFQVTAGVSYLWIILEDIYYYVVDDPLFPLVLILNPPKNMYKVYIYIPPYLLLSLRTERHPDVWHSGGLESDGFKC